MSGPIPRALHLLVRRTGGGTETNINALCRSVPEFQVAALEDFQGPGLGVASLLKAISGVRRIPCDVIFCYGIRAHLVAQMAFPTGKPLVGSIRCESDFAGAKGMWKSIFGRRFFPWISNSRMALFGKEGLVIYNGVAPAPEEAPLLPGLKKPVWGILASGHAKKGHDFLLELWEKIGRPGTLVFAGNLGAELKARAESRGVVCPGYVAAGPLLRSLDLLLVPSTAEGIPTVLLEAMVRGVPCLATPVGGIPEIIRHGENGFCVPREAWEGFLRAVSAEDLARVGGTGREYVVRHHSFEGMKEQFIEAARCAVARGGKAGSGVRA